MGDEKDGARAYRRGLLALLLNGSATVDGGDEKDGARAQRRGLLALTLNGSATVDGGGGERWGARLPCRRLSLIPLLDKKLLRATLKI